MTGNVEDRHLYLRFGEDGNGTCWTCKSPTVLVSFGDRAEVDEEHETEGDIDGVPIGELTGHYCRQCGRLTSLCLND